MKSCSICLRRRILYILFLIDSRIPVVSHGLGMIHFCFLEASCSRAFIFSDSLNWAKFMEFIVYLELSS